MLKTTASDLHDLISSSPEAMIIVDSKGNIVQVNKALEILFGYRAGELASAELDSLLPKRFRQKHVKHREYFFSEAAIRPMSTGLDLYGCRKDDTEFPVEISLHPFATEGGTLVYATIRDVSVLKHTHDLLVAAIEGLPEGFSYYDADDRLAVFNKKMAEIYPLIGDIFQIGTTFEEVLRTGIERGQFVEAQGREEEFYKEKLAYHRDPKGIVDYILPDGRWVRVEEKKTPEGGVVGIRTDITERKKAEESLLKNEKLLTAAIEGMPEGFAYFDADDRLAVFNQRFIQFYPLVGDVVKIGTPYEVVLRTGIERGQFIAPQGRKEEYFKERLAHHRDPKGAVEFMMPDDRCIRVEERKLPGGGIVGIRTDITDEKNIEKQLQAQRDELKLKNAELEAYDHTIAHSLKTPLSASIHFLQILSNFKADNLSTEQHQLVRQAQATLENAGEIVDELLMLSTVSNEQVERKPLDMKRLVKEALRQLEKERLSAQATVLMPARWLPAAGHAPWVGQVWLNYLSNAFKYCEPPVELEIGSSKEGPDSVRYWVQDNGNPLAQEERKQLFVPFSRLHHDRIDGHGLGLTIVQRVVGQLGGVAGVDTPEDGGNRFFFTLPAVRDLPIK